MSGTSLDGLDLALCQFERDNASWDFKIIKAETKKYDDTWYKKLSDAPSIPSEELISLDHNYGVYIGEAINTFLDTCEFSPEFIVSHGHTVFHRPDLGYTLQLGNGDNISSVTNIPVIADLRNKDISLGGQGAPLVPIGDKLLFNNYDACLNLGGFANISFEKLGERLAFDICPVNIVLNELANKEGLAYDSEGLLGRSGVLIPELLEELNKLDYYHIIGPKSLGKEWVDEKVTPLLSKYSRSNADLLHSFYVHISEQISKIIDTEHLNEVLVTGGGGFNTFLMELLSKQSHCKLVIPDKNLINFKEAVIFAFLGILKIRGENNSLASVTGAQKDSSGGVLFGF